MQALSIHAQAARGSKGVHGNVEAGAGIYKHDCAMCHSTEAGVKIVGPSLHSEMKGTHAKTAAQVRQQTLQGQGLMPSFQGKLSDQELLDLIAYIRTL